MRIGVETVFFFLFFFSNVFHVVEFLTCPRSTWNLNIIIRRLLLSVNADPPVLQYYLYLTLYTGHCICPQQM